MNFPCKQIDCLIHPDNPSNKDEPVYRVKDSPGNFLIDNVQMDHILSIHDVEFKGTNSHSDLTINFKNYNLEMPFECLLCKWREPIDMKQEVLRIKTKSLLKEG